MIKQVIMTLSPLEALNVLNGKASMLIRKRVPKDYVGFVWLVVSKKPRLSVVHDDEDLKTRYYINSTWGRSLNNDVIAKYWHEEITKMKFGRWVDQSEWNYMNYNYKYRDFLPKLCLTEKQIDKYGDGKLLYAITLNKLEILDTPLELNEFYKEEYAVMPNGIFPAYQQLTKAPPTYQYVYKEK